MSEGIRRISESGDEFLAPLPPGVGIDLWDVSPDLSWIVFGRYVAAVCDSELWEMPVATAQPRRIGLVCASAAAWSPDGSKLAYNDGRALFLANPDGNAATKLMTLPYDRPTDLRWSPDGRRLRFVLAEGPNAHPRLWEVQIDRRSAEPLLPGWGEDTDNQ